MLKYLKTRKALLAAIVAIVAGFVSAKWLAQGNPLVTLPWGVLAFLAAFIVQSRGEALTLGAIVGFVASYSYLLSDITSKPTLAQIVLLVFVIILPALFGLLCGLLCAWLGWLVRRLFSKTK